MFTQTMLVLSLFSGDFHQQCDPADPAKCAVRLESGDPAPFGGTLLSDDLAISLGQRAESADGRVKLETERLQKLHQVDLKLAEAVAKASLDSEKAAKDAEKRLSTYWEGRALEAEQRISEGPSWYTHPIVVAGITIVGTLVVVALVAGEMQVIQSLAK